MIGDKDATATGRAREDVGELSEMERAVFEPLLVPTLGNLGESWKMVVLVGFEVSIGNTRGMMNLCIPYITIEPIIGRLALRYLYTAVPRAGARRRSESAIAVRAPLDVQLCVDAGTLSVRELGTLRRGTLVPLDEWADGRAFVRCGRVDTFAVLINGWMSRLRYSKRSCTRASPECSDG